MIRAARLRRLMVLIRRALVCAWLIRLGCVPLRAGEIVPVGELQAPMPGARGKMYQLFVPEEYDPDRKYPLMVWLHGAGGRPNVKRWRDVASREGFIVLEPTCPGQAWYRKGGRYIMAAIKRVMEQYSIDENRVIIGGASSGGGQVYQILKEYPEAFAAAVVLVMYNNSYLRPPRAGFPIRIEAGVRDKIANIQKVRRTVAQLKRSGFDVTFIEHEDRGHNVPLDCAEIWQWVKEKVGIK